MKNKEDNTIILDPDLHPISATFVSEITTNSETHVLTGTKDTIIEVAKENRFSTYTDGVVAFGDRSEFNREVVESGASETIISTPEVILFKERNGNYTEDQAKKKYRKFRNDTDNENLPFDYKIFKKSINERHLCDKFRKLSKICPNFYDNLKPEREY